jgi:hypothetical protein
LESAADLAFWVVEHLELLEGHKKLVLVVFGLLVDEHS